MRLLDDPIALFLAARRADNPATQDLRDLAGNGARCASGARHHDRFTGFGLADVLHPEVRRHSVDAEETQREVGRHARQNLVNPSKRRTVGYDIVLPTEVTPHEVTGLEIGVPRLEHLPGSERLHYRAERNRGFVGVARHPDALCGIERQPQDPDQHLAVRRLRDRRFVPAELVAGQLARRADAQNPLAVPVHGHWGCSPIAVGAQAGPIASDGHDIREIDL
jgi:hypothetical protein